MGVEAPLAATTIGRSYRMKTWEWPDAATATLEYPGEFMVTHNGSYGSSVDDGGLEFRGDKGTLKIDRERLLVFREGAPKAAGQYTPEPEIHVRSQGDGTVSHLRNWLDCIRSRRTPNASMRIGHQAVRAAHIANAALGAPGGVRFDVKIERSARCAARLRPGRRGHGPDRHQRSIDAGRPGDAAQDQVPRAG